MLRNRPCVDWMMAACFTVCVATTTGCPSSGPAFVDAYAGVVCEGVLAQGGVYIYLDEDNKLEEEWEVGPADTVAQCKERFYEHDQFPVYSVDLDGEYIHFGGDYSLEEFDGIGVPFERVDVVLNEAKGILGLTTYDDLMGNNDDDKLGSNPTQAEALAESAAAGCYDWLGTNTCHSDDPGSGASGDDCLVGSWRLDSCDGAKTSTITFAAGGSGDLWSPECTGYCDGVAMGFGWSSSGSSVTMTYTSSSVCGESMDLPPADTLPYTCSESSLVLNGQTWSR